MRVSISRAKGDTFLASVSKDASHLSTKKRLCESGSSAFAGSYSADTSLMRLLPIFKAAVSRLLRGIGKAPSCRAGVVSIGPCRPAVLARTMEDRRLLSRDSANFFDSGSIVYAPCSVMETGWGLGPDLMCERYSGKSILPYMATKKKQMSLLGKFLSKRILFGDALKEYSSRISSLRNLDKVESLASLANSRLVEHQGAAMKLQSYLARIFEVYDNTTAEEAEVYHARKMASVGNSSAPMRRWAEQRAGAEINKDLKQVRGVGGRRSPSFARRPEYSPNVDVKKRAGSPTRKFEVGAGDDKLYIRMWAKNLFFNLIFFFSFLPSRFRTPLPHPTPKECTRSRTPPPGSCSCSACRSSTSPRRSTRADCEGEAKREGGGGGVAKEGVMSMTS